MVALLCDVHFAGHAVVEELGLDDGEAGEGGVPDREDLSVVVVHFCAHAEKLDNE